MHGIRHPPTHPGSHSGTLTRASSLYAHRRTEHFPMNQPHHLAHPAPPHPSGPQPATPMHYVERPPFWENWSVENFALAILKMAFSLVMWILQLFWTMLLAIPYKKLWKNYLYIFSSWAPTPWIPLLECGVGGLTLLLMPTSFSLACQATSVLLPVAKDWAIYIGDIAYTEIDWQIYCLVGADIEEIGTWLLRTALPTLVMVLVFLGVLYVVAVYYAVTRENEARDAQLRQQWAMDASLDPEPETKRFDALRRFYTMAEMASPSYEPSPGDLTYKRELALREAADRLHRLAYRPYFS